MIKVTFEGYNEKREKMQLVKIGELVKETEKQIVVQVPLGSTCTINKSKIIERIDDYVLPEAEVVEVVEEDIEFKDLFPMVKDYYDYIEQIQKCEESIVESYFEIGRYLNIIDNDKLYQFEGYKDIYEFAEVKFNYKKTSVVNMISVYNKYKDEKNPDFIDEDYVDYGYTALVELLPVPKDEIKENYSPSDTVVDIRKTKKLSKLDDIIKNYVKICDSVYKKLCNLIDCNNDEIKNNKAKISYRQISKRLDFNDFEYWFKFETSDYNSPFSYCYFELDLKDELIKFRYGKYSFNDPELETKIINYARDLIEEHNKLFVKEDKKEKKEEEKPVYNSFYYTTAIKEKRLEAIYGFLINFFDGISISLDVYKKEKALYDYKFKVGDAVGKVVVGCKIIGYIVVKPNDVVDTFLLLNSYGAIIAHIDKHIMDFTDSRFHSDFIHFLEALQTIINDAEVALEFCEDEEEPEDYGDVDE